VQSREAILCGACEDEQIASKLVGKRTKKRDIWEETWYNEGRR